MESLWSTLNLRKAVLLTEHGQDSFDQLDVTFKEPFLIDEATAADLAQINIFSIKLTNDESNLMRSICRWRQYPKKKNVYNTLALLFKLIVNKLISIHDVLDDENSLNPNMSLESTLLGILEEDADDAEQRQIKEDDRAQLAEFTLNRFKLRHVYHVWKLFVCIYLGKNVPVS